jgi:YidC/Oxa1 family membrane protein insertase
MPVAAGAVAALAGVAAVAPTAVARRSAGGLLPLRRATAPLKARRAAPGRRVSVAARASFGEFPSWDAVSDVAINLHASVITSDLFQISDAAAATAGDAEEIVGLQKGGWLGPITNALEYTLEV